jgi:putative spermidine/putrescine transport system ATP-binding protein
MSGAGLRIEDLEFRYDGGGGVFGAGLEIGAGELVAVMGPSGCGKSTLLKLIGGFLAPARGRIVLGEEDVTAASPGRRGLGIVFQNLALFPHMRAWENVAYPLKLRGKRLAERRAAAVEALDRVGLRGFAQRRPPALSGGQQQRVALARALAFRPRALLLDEPLSALDAATRVAMREEIRRLQRHYEVAALHVTHDQEEALSIADRIAVMREGRIEQTATPAELYDRPANAFVAGFVGRANLIPAARNAEGTMAGALGALSAPIRAGSRPGQFVLLIRPEHVRPGPGPAGAVSFGGRIERDAFLGARRRFVFAVPGGALEGETAERGAFDRVHVLPEHVRALPADPATGSPNHPPNPKGDDA